MLTKLISPQAEQLNIQFDKERSVMFYFHLGPVKGHLTEMIEREEKKPSTRQDSNPRAFDHETCSLLPQPWPCSACVTIKIFFLKEFPVKRGKSNN